MSITAATRSTAPATAGRRSPVFYTWGAVPWTTQVNQRKAALRVTRASGTATAVVTSTTLTLNDGSNHAFTLASYATVDALVTAIVALGSGWSASALNSLGAMPASQLTTLSSTSCSGVNLDLLMQGTSSGDDLLVHPNHRVVAKIGCQGATIDYYMPPGAAANGYDWNEPTDTQIGERVADWQEWQGLTKGSVDTSDLANYQNAVTFVGLSRRPDYDCTILGTEDDVLGADDLSALDDVYGPFLRYGPFAANSITGLYAKYAAVAGKVKDSCDARGVAYPLFIADDVENQEGFVAGAGLSEWVPETPNIYDGGPNYQDRGRGRGSLQHGKLAFSLSVSGTTGGSGSFTTFVEDVGDDRRKVYVSTSGSDANDGLTSATPKQTIAAGVALLRDGKPDWLLLKCGDTWTNEQLAANWLISGQSATKKMLISTYGSGARPILRLTDKSGFRRQGGGASPAVIAHLAIVGIRFEAYNKTPTDTTALVSIIKETHDFLIEDCIMYGGGAGFLCQAGLGVENQDVTINRCVIAECDSTSGSNNQGSYIDHTVRFTCTDNVFDHCHFTNANIFKHNIYIQYDCSPVVFERNFSFRASSNGVQIRPGGVARWNVFSDCPIALNMANGDGTWAGQGINTCDYNVIMAGTDINGSTFRGWGIDLIGNVSGTCKYNIIGQKTTTNAWGAINLTPLSSFNNTEISYNVIRNWYGGIQTDQNNSAGLTYSGVTIHHNKVEERRAASAAAGFMQYALRNVNFTGRSYDNNIYIHTGTLSGHLISGTAKTMAQWQTACGSDASSTYSQTSSGEAVLPTLYAAINAIKGTSLASIADVANYFTVRARGTWDDTISGKAIFDWYNAQVGGYAPSAVDTAATIAITPFKWVAGTSTPGVMTITYNSTPHNITLNETTTIGDVIDAINAISGFAATIAPESSRSDRYYATNFASFVIGAYSDSANPYWFWTLSWPQKYYRGWLQYLVDEPTIADIARRSTETIYQDLVGGVWVNRTFDWWWENVIVAEGLDNFARPSSTDQATLVAAFNTYRIDYGVGQNQNQKQRITLTNAASGTFTASFGGYTTTPIAYNASESAVAAALQALPSIGIGQVAVTKPHGQYWLVEMTGSFALSTKALITIDTGGLSGVITFSGELTPTAKSEEVVRAVTRGTSWQTAPLDTGLAPNVGRTERDFTSGFGSTTLKKGNAFFHAIKGLYNKCIAYRMNEGVLKAFQSALPQTQFACEYGTGQGLRPLFFPTGGNSNVNFGIECGAVPCGAVAPTLYRPYIRDDYSTAEGKFWKPGSWASAKQGGWTWTEAAIEAHQSVGQSQQVCPWLAEVGMDLTSQVGVATWVQTESFLRDQIMRLVAASRDSDAARFWHFLLYCDPNTFVSGANANMLRARNSSATVTSDLQLLTIIQDVVNFAAVIQPRRFRRK